MEVGSFYRGARENANIKFAACGVEETRRGDSATPQAANLEGAHHVLITSSRM
jgi:hypothetical protein